VTTAQGNSQLAVHSVFTQTIGINTDLHQTRARGIPSKLALTIE